MRRGRFFVGHIIGGLHCRHVSEQKKRDFVHLVCIKMKVSLFILQFYLPCNSKDMLNEARDSRNSITHCENLTSELTSKIPDFYLFNIQSE